MFLHKPKRKIHLYSNEKKKKFEIHTLAICTSSIEFFENVSYGVDDDEPTNRFEIDFNNLSRKEKSY